MLRRFIRFLLLFIALAAAPLCWAENATPVEATAVQVSKQVVPAELANPRATMQTFLESMGAVKQGEEKRIRDAARALDLADVNPLVQRERGADLAWMLLEVLDRTRVIEIEKIPLDIKHEWVFETYRNGAIRISRGADGTWRFDRQTVAALPQILEEVSERERVVGSDADAYKQVPWNIRFRQSLPSILEREDFLLENWQWIGLMIFIALGVVFDWITSFTLRMLVQSWQRNASSVFREVSGDVLRPLGLMAMAITWWIGINLLLLPEDALLVLLVGVKFLASISGVWAAYRLVDMVGAWLLHRAKRSRNRVDDLLAPLIPRTLKIFVTVIGIIFVADNLNIDVTGLVAGLGLGGLAFALAAKEMVQNLFGSVSVLMDRTFSIGDWIKVGDREGTVERIGFRSTRLRTFYNSVITIPNSIFIATEVDNMGERRFRRMSTKFSIAYDTPADLIESFCEGIREIVRQHPYMRKDYFHVYLNELGASSLDVLVYVFWETPEWSTELRERHRFLLDCLRLAKKLGIEFAFPTQTLYLRREGWEARGDVAERSQDEAFEVGRAEATEIVDQSTGIGVKPPPVQI